MLTGFAVIRTNLLEELEENFNVKLELDNGLVRYEYYGKEKLADKPRWDSVFYSKDRILRGDIYTIAGFDGANIYDRKESMEYLIDMTDHVVVKIELDDSDIYGTDLCMTKLGDCGTVKQAIELMNHHDPSKEIKISFNTSMNFLLSVIFSEENIDRNISLNTARIYDYSNKLLLENPDELDTSIYKVNIENLKKINSVDARSLIFEGLKESIKDEEIINELALIQAEYLVNIANKNHNIHSSLLTLLRGISDENKVKLLDSIIEATPNKQRTYLFTMFENKFMEDNVKTFLNALYSTVYNYQVIEFFMTNKSSIDIGKVDKKRFIKASSLKQYNELAQYEADPQVTYVSDIISSAGTILSERVLVLACFTNTYSEKEFRELDLDPLADAIITKLVARFDYELRTNLAPILGSKQSNMQYLCDRVIERMCETGVNTVSRVKLIREGASSRNTDCANIYDFLNKSVQESENPKILKAILKLDI